MKNVLLSEDINRNGMVNFSDFAEFAGQCFGKNNLIIPMLQPVPNWQLLYRVKGMPSKDQLELFMSGAMTAVVKM